MEKAETKMKPLLQRALQHTQLPHSQEREVWGKERWKKAPGFFFLNTALTEKESEARCPDLLGGFCWVLQVLLGQGVPEGSSFPGRAGAFCRVSRKPPGIPINPLCSSKNKGSSFPAQG